MLWDHIADLTPKRCLYVMRCQHIMEGNIGPLDLNACINFIKDDYKIYNVGIILVNDMTISDIENIVNKLKEYAFMGLYVKIKGNFSDDLIEFLAQNIKLLCESTLCMNKIVIELHNDVFHQLNILVPKILDLFPNEYIDVVGLRFRKTTENFEPDIINFISKNLDKKRYIVGESNRNFHCIAFGRSPEFRINQSTCLSNVIHKNNLRIKNESRLTRISTLWNGFVFGNTSSLLYLHNIGMRQIGKIIDYCG